MRFEDVVGPLEIAESEQYWFHFAGQPHITNLAVLDALDAWVAMTLDSATLPPPPQPRRPAASVEKAFRNHYRQSADAPLPYGRLVHLLAEKDLLTATAFLSMNYDLLLDRVLHTAGVTPHYHIELFHRANDSHSATASTSVSCLKLHGSLNWRYCSSCYTLRDTRLYSVWPNSACVDCRQQTARPMLIRPTLLKDFRHRIWRETWRAAGHALASARTWVFVGYSLPVADVWMLRLLAQSVRSGGARARDRRIIVVNPDEAVSERFKLVLPLTAQHTLTFDAWADACLAAGGLI
jgi:hypothetical protein